MRSLVIVQQRLGARFYERVMHKACQSVERFMGALGAACASLQVFYGACQKWFDKIVFTLDVAGCMCSKILR